MNGTRTKGGRTDNVRTGIVTTWKPLEGYGFIRDCDSSSGKRIYVHRSNVQAQNQWLGIGWEVSFLVERDWFHEKNPNHEEKKSNHKAVKPKPKHKAVKVQVISIPCPTDPLPICGYYPETTLCSSPSSFEPSIRNKANCAGEWRFETVGFPNTATLPMDPGLPESWRTLNSYVWEDYPNFPVQWGSVHDIGEESYDVQEPGMRLW